MLRDKNNIREINDDGINLQGTGVEVTLCENLEALTIAQTIHEELKRNTDIEMAIKNRNRVVNNMGHKIIQKLPSTLEKLGKSVSER